MTGRAPIFCPQPGLASRARSVQEQIPPCSRTSPEDDRCLDAACFKAKVDAHIAALKENTAGLVQITRAYYTDGKGEEKVLTRNEYTIIEPKQRKQDAEETARACDRLAQRRPAPLWSKGRESAAKSFRSVPIPSARSTANRHRAEQEKAASESGERNGSGSRRNGQSIGS